MVNDAVLYVYFLKAITVIVRIADDNEIRFKSFNHKVDDSEQSEYA
jgi:hypothetical protein